MLGHPHHSHRPSGISWKYAVMLSFYMLLIGATYRLYRALEHRERTAQPQYVDRANPHRTLERQNAFKADRDQQQRVSPAQTVVTLPSPPSAALASTHGQQQPVITLSQTNTASFDPAVILFCFNRTDYLNKTLTSLAALPGLSQFTVIISQACNCQPRVYCLCSLTATGRQRTARRRLGRAVWTRWRHCKPRAPSHAGVCAPAAAQSAPTS